MHMYVCVHVCSTFLVVVQTLSHVQCFVTPWTAELQVSLSFTISQSLFKLMSIELMRPSNRFILYCPFLLMPSIFTSIRVFPMSQFFASDDQRIGASATASALPMNVQS